MNKRNNKGFTLVELIIAMSILSIVLGIGYSIFLKTGKASKNQAQVFNEQQIATIANKYITKDLEQCETIEKIENSETPETYRYIINEKSTVRTPIEYIVVTDMDNGTYNVTRKDGSSSVEIVSNQSTNSMIPFTINYKYELENILIIKINGKNRQGEFIKYEFEVTSRVTDNIIALGWPEPDDNIEGDDEIEQPPIETEKPPTTEEPSIETEKPPTTEEPPIETEKLPTTENKHVVTGKILLTYSRKGSTYTTRVEAEPLVDDGPFWGVNDTANKEACTIKSTESSMRNEINLKAKIPLKSSQLKVWMKEKYENSTKTFGEENQVLGGADKWSLFDQSLITEGIRIIVDDFFTTGLNITINGKTPDFINGAYEYDPKKYYSSESQMPDSFDLDIQWTKGKKNLNGNQTATIKIIFGKFDTN